MRAKSTLRRELVRVKAKMRLDSTDEWERGALYGAMQALSWALGQNAAPPNVLVAAPATRGTAP
jgi:hypothetical protein